MVRVLPNYNFKRSHFEALEYMREGQILYLFVRGNLIIIMTIGMISVILWYWLGTQTSLIFITGKFLVIRTSFYLEKKSFDQKWTFQNWNCFIELPFPP